MSVYKLDSSSKLIFKPYLCEIILYIQRPNDVMLRAVLSFHKLCYKANNSQSINSVSINLGSSSHEPCVILKQANNFNSVLRHKTCKK